MRHASSVLPIVSFAILTFLIGTDPASAADYEIEFRYQPDTTGQATTRQILGLDDDDAEVEITENGKEREVPIPMSEVRKLIDLVKKRRDSFKFEKGERVSRPRVEIKFEFEGNDREIEVVETYPSGKVPAEYVKIQERYFKTPYK